MDQRLTIVAMSLPLKQTISVQDTKAPEFTGVPSDITVECDEVPAPATVTGIDNCDGQIEVEYSEIRTEGTCEDKLYAYAKLEGD